MSKHNRERKAGWKLGLRKPKGDRRKNTRRHTSGRWTQEELLAAKQAVRGGLVPRS
jgi:hypothetical protein